MRNTLIPVFMIFACLCSVNVNAAIEDYVFENQEHQQQFRQLSDQLRCPMCLNSNLAGSDAPIAADLRAEIYQQILEGRSNDEIIDFMTQRYGDFINYRPPLNRGTFMLWFGPLILLLIGMLVAWRIIRNNQNRPATAGLSTEEQQKLDSILADNK